MRSKNNLHAEVSTSTLDWASSLHSWVNSLSTGRSNPSDRIPHTRSLSFDSNDDEFEMTQTYGVASERSPEPSTAGFGEESRALLGNDTAPVRQRAEGHANIISSVSNLANTIIGSGMLTFPLAMASAGIIPGIITCVFSGSVAAFGLYLLSVCASRTPHRRSSFFAVAQLTYPNAAIFFDAAIAIKCFGVSISYLIIIKKLMPQVVQSLYHDLTSEETNPPDWLLSEHNWLTMFMLILVPLAFLRRIHSLRHTSYIALVSIVYLVVIVIRCYFKPLKGMPKRGEIHYVHFTSNFVSTFPVQVFAFTCAQNVFAIYNELKQNTQERMNIVIGSSIGGATLIYEIIAVFGYLTFGSTVKPNIIEMYPSTSLFVALGQLVIVILVLFSYPLQVHPCRNCLDKVFHAGQIEKPAPGEPPEQEEESEHLDDDHAVIEMSAYKHTLLTVAIISSGFTIAYFVSDLKLVLSFVGSTGSTTISFILPGLFYWKMSRHHPELKPLGKAAFGLMLYGIGIFVFCLSFNIYQVTHAINENLH